MHKRNIRLANCCLFCCRLNKKGATTTEYSLILALVVIVLITTLRTLGTTLNAKLHTIISSLNGA